MGTVNSSGKLVFDATTDNYLCEREQVRNRWEKLRLRDIEPVEPVAFQMLMKFISWCRKVDVLPELVRGAK